MSSVTHPHGLRAVAGSRFLRRAGGPLIAGALLAALTARVGAGPFLHGLQSVDALSVVWALLLSAVASAAAAWRWSLISGRLRVRMPWRRAFGLYYRSQFLNAILPGGVIGDVHRAVDQGRRTGSADDSARAVAIDRLAGQVVQILLTVGVLGLLGVRFESALLARGGLGIAVALAAGLVVGAGFVVVAISGRARGRLRFEARRIGAALGTPAAAGGVVLASTVVVGCLVGLFVVAARTTGVRFDPQTGVALALVILLASSLPVNVGGWGPREGAAAWAFALVGLGGDVGVSASTLFGVLALIGVAPGAIVALALHRAPRRPS